MKYIKTFESRQNWSWPRVKRLIELGLEEPDLFNCWTRVKPSSSTDSLRAVELEFETIAAQFGVVRVYSGPGIGQTEWELRWAGPVEGLQHFADGVQLDRPNTIIWGWGRLDPNRHAEELAAWYAAFVD